MNNHIVYTVTIVSCTKPLKCAPPWSISTLVRSQPPRSQDSTRRTPPWPRTYSNSWTRRKWYRNSPTLTSPAKRHQLHGLTIGEQSCIKEEALIPLQCKEVHLWDPMSLTARGRQWQVSFVSTKVHFVETKKTGQTVCKTVEHSLNVKCTKNQTHKSYSVSSSKRGLTRTFPLFSSSQVR